MKETVHALKRRNERSISDSTINIARNIGYRIRRHGVVFIYVRDKDIPARTPEKIQRQIKGMTLVEKDGLLITAFRDHRNFYNKIKRSSKQPRRRARMFSQFTDC